MDFRIEPGSPDGIRVRAEFYVDTWVELALLMDRLEDVNIAANHSMELV